MLDPVITASSSTLRFEGFSGCCGAYVQVGVPASAIDGMFHRRGTTNVDFTSWLWNALGDPMEDLGWLCVKAWRFGSPHRVGGFGALPDLLRAYERESGQPVDADVVHWWEVLGTLKWGIMCIAQAFTHLSGAARSVELATIGRRVCENEWDLLELMA